LEEHFAVLYKKQKLLEETGKPKGPVTRSEWFKELKLNHKITVNRDLINKFTMPDSTKHLPLPRASLYRITNRGKEPSDKNIEGTRELFGDIVSKWKVPNRTQDIGSTAVQTLGTHKPDHLMRMAGRRGEQSIITADQVTPMASEQTPHCDFSDEQVGQELDFLQMALQLQPWRTFVYGFLTDTRRFEFFRAVRDIQRGILFENSGVYSDKDGWIALQRLLSQSDEILGFQDVSLPGWDLDCWLGSGATSVVFSIKNQDNSLVLREAVCKMYIDRETGETQRAKEVRALELLNDQLNVPHPVPGAPVKTRSGLSVLVKTPVGVAIPDQMRVPVSAYASLVSTLQIAHKRGLLHNDVSPSSVFAMPTGDVLLNDWGSSATAAEIKRGMAIGTRALYYNTSTTRPFGAAADLCALVRSVFYLTQATFSSGDTNTCAEMDAIMEKQLPVWRKALRLARSTNYAGLKALLAL
jgi:hypothetical protein